MDLRDTVRDVLLEYAARPARIVLMVVAVALSTGSLVAAIGFSTTAGRQISADIAASGTDVLTVRGSSGDLSAQTPADASAVRGLFPEESVDAVRSLDLVESAGLRLEYPDSAVVSRLPGDGTALATNSFELFGAEPGYLRTVGVDLATAWALESPVGACAATLGSATAQSLGVPRLAGPDDGYAIQVDGRRCLVAGVIHGSARVDTTHWVVLAYATALAVQGSDAQAVLHVLTEPGGGAPVAAAVGNVLSPAHSDRFDVSTAVSLRSLRVGVSSQLGRLTAIIGAVLLVLTGLLISNAMVVSVTARTAEIGLRRAIGGSRRSIWLLFVTDGVLTGLLGGLAGAALGAVAVVVVAYVSGWTPVLQVWNAALGPALGGLVGVVASSYPALRASRVSPAEAVRAE